MIFSLHFASSLWLFNLIFATLLFTAFLLHAVCIIQLPHNLLKKPNSFSQPVSAPALFHFLSGEWGCCKWEPTCHVTHGMLQFCAAFVPLCYLVGFMSRTSSVHTTAVCESLPGENTVGGRNIMQPLKSGDMKLILDGEQLMGNPEVESYCCQSWCMKLHVCVKELESLC